MRLKNVLLCILFALAVSACAGGTAPASQVPTQFPASYPDITSYPDAGSYPDKNSPDAPSLSQSPTSHSDTPSPARIDAPRVESPAVITLDMLNELEGWAVTATELVRTNDGGITWYNVSPPDMVKNGYSIGSFFLDQDHAWIQVPDMGKYPNSGALYRTTDGGLTWESFIVPFSEGDLTFIDAENGWMLAGLGIGAGSNAVAVFQTTDGGATWEQTYTNDPNDLKAANSLPLGGLKSDLIPMDMKTAWVTGLTYASGDIYLYRTDNGGQSWMPVEVELPPDAKDSQIVIDKNQLDFVSKTDGYLVLHISGESVQTAVYVTRDAGHTWSLTPTVIDGAGPSSFLTPQEMILYDSTDFQLTRDAAQSWTSVAPNIALGDTFVAMDFVNLMSGWVITMDPSSNHRSLYRTQDGGQTWLPVVP
jgi:photosystem II stability/assembly factor-like uncharacterized protein